MVASLDESATQYGWIAREVEYPDDYSWLIYHLRPEARFHDSVPVTAEDVVHSVELLRKGGLPYFHQVFASVAEVRQLDTHTVLFRFVQKGDRGLLREIGELTFVLPKHFWQGKDASGRTRDFSRSTLERPLGSGPYRVGKFEPERFIEYERVKDYGAETFRSMSDKTTLTSCATISIGTATSPSQRSCLTLRMSDST